MGCCKISATPCYRYDRFAVAKKSLSGIEPTGNTNVQVTHSETNAVSYGTQTIELAAGWLFGDTANLNPHSATDPTTRR